MADVVAVRKVRQDWGVAPHRFQALVGRLFEDETFHDVRLRGNDGVVESANCSVLAASSDVFKSLFFGGFKEQKRSVGRSTGHDEDADLVVVDILGFEGAVLRSLLEYVHKDSVSHFFAAFWLRDGPTTSTTATPTFAEVLAYASHVVSLACAAEYFNLPGLLRLTLHQLNRQMNLAPVLALGALEACYQMGAETPPALRDAVQKKIRRLAMFDHPAYFHHLSGPVIESILRDPELHAAEFNLFEMLLTQAYGAGANGSTVGPIRARVKTFVDRPRNACRDSIPMKIQVVGAGSDCVNGTYTMVKIVDGYCQYTMAGRRFDELECVFTLSRCMTQSGRKWWFISIADTEQPGTDRDIDFYRSQYLRASRYPHHSGVWSHITAGKGVYPAPRLFYSTHERHLDYLIIN
jgi:hypothetical protein